MRCYPLPVSIVEGEARALLERLAGYDAHASRTVRRVPRHDPQVIQERERRAADMDARRYRRRLVGVIPIRDDR